MRGEKSTQEHRRGEMGKEEKTCPVISYPLCINISKNIVLNAI